MIEWGRAVGMLVASALSRWPSVGRPFANTSPVIEGLPHPSETIHAETLQALPFKMPQPQFLWEFRVQEMLLGVPAPVL